MKELARCLYGSQSYMLDNDASDKDYKVFLCPTFDDMYANHRVDKGDLPVEYPREGDHFSVMDVRSLVKYVCNGNVNVCEYLFSTEWHMDAKFADFLSAAQKLYNDGYLLVCWETFFASLEGMVKNSLDRYGVTRKSMSRAYYFYMLAMSLVVDNFRMTEKSWRGNAWNKSVREMRFNEDAWMPSREELECTLKYVKEEGKKSVERMRKYRPELVEELRVRAEQLKAQMKELVAHELKYEMLMGDF